MTANADEMTIVGQHRVVLLIDRRRLSLLPLNQRGLTRTQKSRSRLRAEYPGVDLLLPTGQVLPITDFEVGRATDLRLPWPFAWLSLTGERSLTIKFGPLRQEAIDESKSIVIDCLARDSHRDEWLRGDEKWEQLLANVANAQSHAQIFTALHLVDDDDGLDVFS